MNVTAFHSADVSLDGPHLIASLLNVLDLWLPRRTRRERTGSLVVYTAIFGAIPDVLRPPRGFRKNSGVRCVCYTDASERGAESPWETRPPFWSDADPRRTARYHKTHPHVLFPEADYSVWHDGNIRLRIDPWRLVDEHLGDGVDIASFKHRDRSCVYEELEACIRFEKDRVEPMRLQVDRYRREGYPAHNGLAETGVLVRRHSERVREFNEAWWSEIQSGSVRDQLSFNVVLWRLGLRQSFLPGQSIKSPYAHYMRHR